MYRLDARSISQAIGILVAVGQIIERAEPNECEEKLSTATRDTAKPLIEELKSACETLGARVTLMEVERTATRIESQNMTLKDLGEAYDSIFSRLRDEVSLTEVWVIDPERVRYLKSAVSLFGDEPTLHFPASIRDIEDAGKCLAFGCGTAAVFHLMRIMEVGLKALSKEMGIPYAPSWESHLRQIASKIDDSHKKKTAKWKLDEPFFRDVSGDLQTVKQAWRNPTMHIVRTYTPNEAEDVFRAVRSFMQRLTARHASKVKSVNALVPVKKPRD